MRLRNSVFSGRIIGRAIDRTDRSLSRHTTLELSSHFLSAAVFHWIGASACDQRERA